MTPRPWWMAHRPAEGRKLCVFLLAAQVIHFQGGQYRMTKAQEVYEKVNTLIEGGAERPDAFKQRRCRLRAASQQHPRQLLLVFARSHRQRQSAGPRGARPPRRTRWPTPEPPLNARSTAIDREVEVAGERAREAKAEHEALKAQRD